MDYLKIKWTTDMETGPVPKKRRKLDWGRQLRRSMELPTTLTPLVVVLRLEILTSPSTQVVNGEGF